MDDVRLIPLAALQHYAFCPRQCALIHNEGLWSENWHTAQGALLHERVHAGGPERRKGVRFERGALVAAPALGIGGKLDLLEINKADDTLTPVEYKRGRPKAEDWDRIQLCAQVLCLEEMRGVVIEVAALWYWGTRRRVPVPMTAGLRARTRAVIAEVRELLDSGVLPPPQRSPACRACSLADDCGPDLPGPERARQYAARLLDPAPWPEVDDETEAEP